VAIPTGSGSEVLKNSVVYNQGAGEVDLIDLTVSGIWIATILTIVVTNSHPTENGFFDIHIVSTSPAGDIKLVEKQASSALSTFIFNDRVVIADGQKLAFERNGSNGGYDIITSYILQDWT